MEGCPGPYHTDSKHGQAQPCMGNAATWFYQEKWPSSSSDHDEWISKRLKPWLITIFSKYSHFPSHSCVRRVSAASCISHTAWFAMMRSGRGFLRQLLRLSLAKTWASFQYCKEVNKAIYSLQTTSTCIDHCKPQAKLSWGFCRGNLKGFG